MVDEILTADEAAAYLKIERHSLYRLAKDKKIKCVKIGNRYRFLKRDIEAFVSGESENLKKEDN